MGKSRTKKAAGITLGSLAGLAVLIIAALLIILSPSKLTPLVNRYATEYLDATLRFDTVRLSFFEEFPTVSLKLSNGEIVSDAVREDSLRPVRADTLMRFRELAVSVAAGKLLWGKVEIQRIRLAGADVYAYVSPSGKANWEIYKEEDVAAVVEQQDSAPLDLNIDRIALRDGVRLVYDSRADSMKISAELERMFIRGSLVPDLSKSEVNRLTASGLKGRVELRGDELATDIVLDTLGIRSMAPEQTYDLMTSGRVSLWMEGSRLCDAVPVSLKGGVGAELKDTVRVALRDFEVHVAEIPVALNGGVTIGDGSIDSDLQARIERLAVADLLKLAPAEYADKLDNVETNLTLGLDVRVTGRYGFTEDGRLPVVDIDCSIPGGYLGYRGVESRIEHMAVDMGLHFDPAEPEQTGVEFRKIAVDGRGVRLHGKAAIRNIPGDPQVTAAIAGTVNIRDMLRLAPQFGPEGYGVRARGIIGLELNGRFRASDLTPQRIARADLKLKLTVDSLRLRIPKDTVSLMAMGTTLTFESYAAVSRRTGRRGGRMFRFTVEADTARLSIRRAMRISVSRLGFSGRTSGEIAGGEMRTVPRLGGRVTARYFRMNDIDSTDIRARNMQVGFRLLPFREDPTLPVVTLQIQAPRLSYRMEGNNFRVTDADLTVRATRNPARRTGAGGVNSERFAQFIQRRMDSLGRLYPDVSQDSLRVLARRSGGARGGRIEDEFAYADIDMKADQSVLSFLREWTMQGRLKARGGRLATPYFPLRTTLRSPDIRFTTDSLILNNTRIVAGQSQFRVTGRVDGIRRALSGRGRLNIAASMVADTLNVNELLIALYQGADFMEASDEYKRSLLQAESETQLEELIAERSEVAATDEMPLIIIPRNITADLKLQVMHGVYADMVLESLAGELSIRDRILQLKELSADTDLGAATLTAIYSTRSKEELSAGFDLELKDIRVERLISLIPQVDTLLPMLRSFEGLLNCQIAATTRIDTLMNIVLPTLNGVCRIRGNDMVLLDGETFTQIAKMLKFKNRDKNHIDAVSVEMLLRNNQIEIFPFVLEMDRYQTAISGLQGLDMSFNYHISVIHSPLPFRLGVNIAGTDPDHMKIRLGRAKYKNAELPSYVAVIDTTRLNLRTQIGNIVSRGMDMARLNQTMRTATSVDTRALHHHTEMEGLSREDSLQLAREGIIRMDTSFVDRPTRREGWSPFRRDSASTDTVGRRREGVVSARRLGGAVQTTLGMRNDSTGIWTDAGWRNSANILTAVIRYAQVRGPQNRHREAIGQTIAAVFARGKEQAPDFWNDHYEDEGWWALAWIDAFHLTGDSIYLRAGETLFADMTTGWSEECGGGIYRSKAGRDKNAVANNLFSLCAIRLYKATGNELYRDWFTRNTAWFIASGMIRPDMGLVDDGLNADGTPMEGSYHAYNQGVAVAVLTEMYLFSGEEEYLDMATRIADATIDRMVDENGILRERCEPDSGADGIRFKGVFLRHLGFLYRVSPQERHRDFMVRNAIAILENDYDPESRCFGGLWTGPFDTVHSGAHASAMECLIEAYQVTQR